MFPSTFANSTVTLNLFQGLNGITKPAPQKSKTLKRAQGDGWLSKMAKKMADYAIMVEPLSERDGGGWLASVPALSGCMGDGETPEDALADAERAIDEWLDAAKALGREMPGPSALGQWRQRVPRSLQEKLKIVAAREGVSLNSYVANVLAENVGRAT